jgi:hypothetical protein
MNAVSHMGRDRRPLARVVMGCVAFVRHPGQRPVPGLWPGLRDRGPLARMYSRPRAVHPSAQGNALGMRSNHHIDSNVAGQRPASL